jgi:hypothetical protein
LSKTNYTQRALLFFSLLIAATLGVAVFNHKQTANIEAKKLHTTASKMKLLVFG